MGLLAALPAALAQDQNWEFFTQAGNGTAGESNGAGTGALFNRPIAVALDSQGNMIVADAAGQTIRRVSFSDGVTTLAGPTGFGKPAGVAVDSSGTIYVADSVNHTIDMVSGDGSVSVIAGTSGTPGSADGSGTSARFNGPTGLTLDDNGNLYVADTGNSTIRQLALNNSPVKVTTIAGTATVTGHANGSTGTTFNQPQGLAFSYNGVPMLYVADTNNDTIRAINLNNGQVSLYAGITNSAGHSDGPASSAIFNTPTSIASDGNGDLFVTDFGSDVIREIDGSGNVTTLGGVNGTPGNSDGIGTAALFKTPHGVAADNDGNVYVADMGNNEIRIGFSEDNVGFPLFAVFEQINLDQTSAATPALDPIQPYSASAQSPDPGTVVVTPTATGMGSLSLPFDPRNVDFEVDDASFPSGSAGLADLEVLDGTYTFTAPGQPPDSVSITDDWFPTTGPKHPSGLPPEIISATNAGWVGGVLVVLDPTQDAVLTLATYPGWGALAAPAFDHMQVQLRGQNDNVSLDQEAFSSGVMGAPASDPITSFTIPAKTLAAGNFYNGQIQYNTIVDMNDAGLAGYNVSTSFTVAAQGPAPTIPGGDEPQSASVYAGQQASFSVGNNGNNNFTYQWMESTDGGKTWADLSDNGIFSGSQTQNLQISSVTSAMNGAEFVALVSNIFGSTPSNPATLTVLSLVPTVVLQSPSETVYSGQAVSFSAGATGAGPLSYQWQELTKQGGAWTNLTDGNGIVGSETGTLTVGSASPSMSGYEFQLVVKNSSGTATSTPVTLTVTPVPYGDGVGFDFTTPAGLPPGSADGTGSAARFRSPNATATDTAHNIYVADSGNDTIRMITPAGVVTTLAGSAGVAGSADGQGTAARFNNPTGIAVDGVGNLYVADGNNYTVRKITPATAGGVTTWTVTTLAGQAGRGGTNNGTGSAAQFNYLGGLAVDVSANVYVADSNNNAIRKITPGGVVTTFAGIPGSSGSANGAASSALFSNPSGVALNSAGDLYVADTNNSTIRLITQGGVVSTLAGQVRNYSFSDGTGTAALFNQPGGVAVDAGGNVYVADSGNNAIRVIAAGGVVTTVEGNADRSGSTDGTGSAALFYNPTGLSVDDSRRIYVADNGNSTIRKIEISSWAVTTLAGVASAGSADGAGSSALFNAPHGLAVDSAGNVYVADSDNGTIRRITSGGSVSTLAGQAGDFGASDGTGSGAQFAAPIGVAVDGSGNVYVADEQGNTIRKVTPGGVVTTLAGSAWDYAWLDGTGTAARFASPHSLAVDTAGNLYVADEGDDTIREITSGGIVTTIAGKAFTQGSANGVGAAAEFNTPTALAVDGQGDLYVADNGNSTVRKITPTTVSGVTTWTVTTLAGSSGNQGTVNGIGTEAQFNGPDYLTIDGAGNVYVTEPSPDTIRKITPAGVVTTVGGSAWNMGTVNGLGAQAEFDFPTGIAIDGSGNLYVSDTGNNTVRVGTPTPEALPAISVQPGSTAIPPLGNASFTVIASSNTSLSYGWLVSTDGGNSWTSVSDGNGISGSATSSITVDGVPAAYSGVELEAVVSNEAGTVTTSPATLTVSSNPLIELQSGSETILAGQGVSFSVGVASSSAASYQWQELPSGGSTWTNLTDVGGVSGSATATLNIGATAAGSLGGYEFRLVATNTSGSTTSAPVTLTVSPVPAGASLLYAFSTIAGQSGVGSTDSPNGPGSAARFNDPSGVAVDAAGNVYVADSNNDVIRRVSAAGDVTTLAGADGSAGFSNGLGSAAQFRNPGGIALDAQGNLYVADSGNNAVRKIAPSGSVSTLAGGGGSGNLDGAGSAAKFSFPRAVAVDASGTVYVSDSGNNEIRKIDASGNVTTLAGAGQRGSSDGQGSAAQFGNPVGVAVDSLGNVFVADSNNGTIREISQSGAVTTFAGQAGHYGYLAGTGTAANFSNPQGLAIDGSGNLYVTDSNNQTVRTITPTGVVALLAGSVYRSGAADGPASTAQFNGPIGVAVDAAGNVYVADSGSDTVRKFTAASATVSTLAGQAGIGSTDSPGGPGSAARFFSPQGAAVDSAGNVYVADSSNGTVRRINRAGDVTTLAGFAGQFGNTDGAGSAARFSSPQGVAVDVMGSVYVADANNNSIRVITPSGSVSTLAGGAGFGNSDGTGSAARFNSPQGVAVDLLGNVYVADTSSSSIRMITPSGAVSTLAGGAGSGWADGVGSAAMFWFPRGIAVDGAGNLYIADADNAVIRKITPTSVSGVTTWTVSTLAGNPSFRGSFDGTGTSAQFSYPSGLAIDTSGNLYVTDGSNDVIRMVTPAGVVTTVGGIPGQSGSTDGIGSAARFDQPYGIAVDGAGNLYIADTSSETIREGVLTLVAPPSITGQPASTTIAAGGTASFSAAVTSSTTVSFQWQVSTDGGNTWNSLRDGNGISGSETANLSGLDVPASENGYEFEVVVSNAAGSVTSSPATLTVNGTLGFTAQPASETVLAGAGASFTAGVAGTPTPTYLWQVSTDGGKTWAGLTDGGGITGSATATLSFTATTLAQSGNEYEVVATNSTGSITSNPVTLTVQVLPTISTQPAGETVLAGAAATFTVSSSGTPTPTLQWQVSTDGGKTWTNLNDGNGISGSATATLTIASVTTAQSGEEFEVVAANAAGSATSNAVALTVNTLPTVSSQPIRESVNAGQPAGFDVGVSGSPTPTVQWQVSLNGGNSWTNLTNGSGFSGVTTPELKISFATVAMSGDEFRAVLTSTAGTVDSAAAGLTVAAIAPSITTQPASQSAVLNASVTFTVTVSGTSPFTYQWNFNGSAITDAGLSSYTIASVQTVNAGNYTVTVTNAGGSVTSNGATLTVNPVSPTITSPITASGIVGATFNYLATTSASVATFSITSGTLPTGLSLNAKSGAITGTPTAAGTSNVTLTATNLTGVQSTTLSITISPPAPVVTSPIAARGQVGASFSYTIQASNSPTSFGATGLPTGLTVSSAGVISGTPMQAGTFTVTVFAGNGTGTTSQTLQLVITPAANAPVYTGATQASGKENASFSFSPNFGSGITGYVLVNVAAATPSVLPTGLTLDPSAGTISGTPTQTGTFLIAIQATNAGGSTTQDLTITINAPPAAPSINSASTATATVGTAFTFTVSSSPSASSYAATGLPPGLTLASSGSISGTPTASGTYNVSITPTLNGVGSGKVSILQISVSPAVASPVVTSSASAIGQVGSGFSFQVTASGSPTGFAVTSGSLPAGLNLNTSSGAITGVPTQSGSSEAWIAASNSSGQGLALGVSFTINPAPATPAITSNTTVTAQVGQPFSYVIAASNTPTSFSASGLPSGLTLSASTGVITGLPSAATTQPISVTLTATNVNGTGAATTLLLSINPAPATPVIISAAYATGQAGTAFSYQISASYKATSFSALNLPPGLSVDPTAGTITGTPTQAGTYDVSLAAANSAGLGASTSLYVTITAAPAAPVITSSASDSAKVGVAYSYAIEAAPGPVTSYNVTGSLPLGLVLDTSDGVLSGTPAESGVFVVEFTATSGAGTSEPQSFVLVVAPAEGVPAITSSLSENATVGSAFSYTIMANNVPATTPFPPSVTLDAVDLPPGLAVNPSTGVIAGTPTLQGTYTVGLQGVNAAGSGSIAYLTITVGAAPSAPTVNSASAAQAQVGQPFAYTIAATNNPTSFQVLNAPAWMTVNSQTGVLGGTPITPANVSVQLEAINAAGTSQPLTLTISVAAILGTPVITSGQSQTGEVGTALTYDITATNSPTSYTATGLPAGLNLNPTTGVISGTPTASGTYEVTLSASNLNISGQGGDSNPVTLTLTINATDSIDL